MTNEEAVEKLEILKEDYWDDDGYGHKSKLYDDTELALDMAIKALVERKTDTCQNDGKDCSEYDQFVCSKCGNLERDSRYTHNSNGEYMYGHFKELKNFSNKLRGSKEE